MDLGDLFKDLVWNALVKAALSKLFAAVPLLGWGPIGFVITWIATRYADELYDGIKLFINIELIAFRNKEFEKMYANASVKLKIIAKDHGIESEEFKNARVQNRKSLEDFARYNGARAA